MTATNDNVTFCQKQIERFAGTEFWNQLTTVAVGELVKSLVVSADSPADAEAMVSAHLLTSRQRPTPADFALVAQQRRDEARASVSWKPADPPPTRDGVWTKAQRDAHDKWFAEKLASMPDVRDGPKKKIGLKPAVNTIIAIVKAVPPALS